MRFFIECFNLSQSNPTSSALDTTSVPKNYVENITTASRRISVAYLCYVLDIILMQLYTNFGQHLACVQSHFRNRDKCKQNEQQSIYVTHLCTFSLLVPFPLCRLNLQKIQFFITVQYFGKVFATVALHCIAILFLQQSGRQAHKTMSPNFFSRFALFLYPISAKCSANSIYPTLQPIQSLKQEGYKTESLAFSFYTVGWVIKAGFFNGYCSVVQI